MMTTTTIVGVDPGTTTGVAVYRDGNLHALHSSTHHELDALITVLAPDMLLFEDSRLQSAVWTARSQSRAQALKIARNVGMVDQMCADIEEVCRLRGVVYVGLSPLDKGSKVDAAAFKALTGWDKQSNQHCRDAAMLAWPYRRGSGMAKRGGFTAAATPGSKAIL